LTVRYDVKSSSQTKFKGSQFATAAAVLMQLTESLKQQWPQLGGTVASVP